jgi:hypothetical protein
VVNNIPLRFTTIEQSFSTSHSALREEATTTVGRLNELDLTVDSLEKRVDALDIKVWGPIKAKRNIRGVVKRAGEGGGDQGSGSASSSFKPPRKPLE